MNRKTKMLISIGISLAVTAGVVWMLNTAQKSKEAPAVKQEAMADAPNNAAHELASLEAQREKNPNHPPILLRMAELKRTSGKPKEAVEILSALVKAEPKLVDAHLELGRALYESGDPEAALAATKKVLEIEPKQTDALYNIGAIYGNLGRDEMAKQYFNEAVKANESSESGKQAKAALAQLAQASPAHAQANPAHAGMNPTPSQASAEPGKKVAQLPMPLPRFNNNLPAGHPVMPGSK